MQFEPQRTESALRAASFANRFTWPPALRFVRLSFPRPAVALPLVLGLLAFLLRLHGLADKPLWYDEILSLNRARLPLADLVIDALKHKHYPTYFLLLRSFASAHVDPWMLRLPSALCGAGCAFLVARMATDIRGTLAGIVAGLLMTLSPLEVQYGQEARAYALISCLVLIALWGVVRIAQEPRRAALSVTRPDGLRGPWAAYALGTIGALLVENNTVPWLLASNIAFIAVARRAATERSGLIRNWVWSQTFILVVWLPVLFFIFSANRGAVLTGLEWVPQPTWESFRSIVAAVYLFRISDMMSFGILPSPLPQFGALIVALALLGAWRLKREPCLLAIIGLGFVAMPIMVLAISIFQPVLVPRYLLWSTGPFFVMAGIGAAALPKRLSPVVAAAVMVGGVVSLWPYYSAETKPRWDQAAPYLLRNVRPQDSIVAEYPSVEFVLDTYAEPTRLASKFTALAWKAHRSPLLVADGERTWVIYGSVGQSTQESEEEFRRKWAVLGNPADQVRFGSHILVLRFDKPTIASQQSLSSARLERNDGTAPHNPPMP
jgi:mannosyltransferase